MDGAAVTLFENTTLFVQGVKCVQFMTDTFPRIRDDVYSSPAAPSTPVQAPEQKTSMPSEQETDSLSITESPTQKQSNESLYQTPVAVRNTQSLPKVLYKASPEKQNLDADPATNVSSTNTSGPANISDAPDSPEVTPVTAVNTSVADVTHVSESLLPGMDDTVIDAALTSTPYNDGRFQPPCVSSIPTSQDDISSPSVSEKVVSLRVSMGVQTDAADETKQLEKDLSACKSEFKMTLRENEELHRKIAQLKDDLKDVKPQNDNMELLKSTKDENDKLIIQVSALTAGIKMIEQKHSNEKQSLVVRISELEAQVQDIETIKVEKQSLTTRISELECEVQELEAIKAANMEYEFEETHDDETHIQKENPLTPNQTQHSTEPSKPARVRPSWDDDAAFSAFTEPIYPVDDCDESAAMPAPRRPLLDNDAAFNAFNNPILPDDDPEESTLPSTPASDANSNPKKKKKKRRKNVIRFRSDSKTHFELSNLYHCYLYMYGQHFISKEHAYQWEKAMFHGRFDEARQILAAPNAKEAMRIGQNIKTNHEWKTSVKFSVMEEIQRTALVPGNCDEFRKVLLSTKGKSLEEATTHPTWGADGENSKNRLGQLLEALRDEILEKETTGEAATKSINTSNQKNSSQPNEQSPASLGNARNNSQLPTPPVTTQPPPSIMKKGLIFSDSFGLGVNPRNEGYVWSSAPYPGAKVCPTPDSKYPDMVAELQSQLKSEPDDTVLAIGANDVHSFKPDEFRRNYHNLVVTAKAAKSIVTCSGIFHRGDGTYSQVCRANQTIDKMNAIIRDIAREEHCGFIDNNFANSSTCNEPSLDILTNPSDGRARFLHLKPEAQQVFAFRIAEYIDLPSAVPPPAIVNAWRTEKQYNSQGSQRRYVNPEGGAKSHSGSRSSHTSHPRRNPRNRRW